MAEFGAPTSFAAHHKVKGYNISRKQHRAISAKLLANTGVMAEPWSAWTKHNSWMTSIII
jgi:hypothetical protein